MTAAFDQVAMSLDAGTPVLLASVSEPDAIRVLLIEEGAVNRGFLANELSGSRGGGFAVQTVTSLAGTPDAVGDADVGILLHCDWAQISGIDLLGKLHQRGFNVPIVLLTGGAFASPRMLLALDKPPDRRGWQLTGLGGSGQAPQTAPSRPSGVRAKCGPAGAWPRPARRWRRPKR